RIHPTVVTPPTREDGAPMPWTQNNYDHYYALVLRCNERYERFLKSRLHTFTGLLKMKRFQNTDQYRARIKATWEGLEAEVRTKYQLAWEYVRSELFAQQGLPAPAREAARAGRALQRRLEQQSHQVLEPLKQELGVTSYEWTVKMDLRLPNPPAE